MSELSRAIMEVVVMHLYRFDHWDEPFHLSAEEQEEDRRRAFDTFRDDRRFHFKATVLTHNILLAIERQADIDKYGIFEVERREQQKIAELKIGLAQIANTYAALQGRMAYPFPGERNHK